MWDIGKIRDGRDVRDDHKKNGEGRTDPARQNHLSMEAMKITLNNKAEEIAGKDSLTVRELLDYKSFSFKFLVVRINGKTIRPSGYEDSIIRDGDQVQVIHLISGG